MWEGSMWCQVRAPPAVLGEGPGGEAARMLGGTPAGDSLRTRPAPQHCPPRAVGNSQARSHQHLGSGWAPSQTGCAAVPARTSALFSAQRGGPLRIRGCKGLAHRRSATAVGHPPLPRARIAGADHQPGEPMLIPTVHSNWNRLPSGCLTR